jgi:2-deoxy-D-gluconate 3-dehydrogenase
MKDVLEGFSLNGQVIIITGGAGLLGREYALTVTQAGGQAVIADIDREGAEQAADFVAGETGQRPVSMQVDVSVKESVVGLVDQMLERFGRVDGLVNNAALDPKFDTQHAHQHTNSFEDFPLELWNQGLVVNLTGMFLCAQAVAPAMLHQEKGSIINISSTYGLVGPDQRLYSSDDPQEKQVSKPVIYSVTKSAVLGLTRYLAAYWAGKGIRVNALTPGGVFNDHDDEFVRRYSARTPLGRMADKAEYNGALLFLLSDASSYMTGGNLVVDGGWTAW